MRDLNKKHNGARGFTLIELMITLAIVGILAAVAWPSYQSYLTKSRRTDGRAVLQAAQLAQEKFRINHTNYGNTSDLDEQEFNKVCVWSGTDCMSSAGYYKLTSANGTTSGYTMTATPVGIQAGDATACTLTVTQTSTGVTYGPSGCWSN